MSTYKMNKPSNAQVEAEIDAAVAGMRRWSHYRQGEDCGSYCENASRAYNKMSRVIAAYKQLRNELMQYAGEA